MAIESNRPGADSQPAPRDSNPVSPRPNNEEKRLEALRRYHILDTAPEREYDDITTLAAYICATPVAFVSLVDAERQWFKSKVGMDTDQTSRDIAFCAHTVMGEEILVVPDALLDERFAHSPLTQAPHHVRFYAGMPLVTPDGYSVGALCVVDHEPRTLNPEQTRALAALSRQIVRLLEQRRVAADLARALEEIRVLQGILPICAHCKKIRNDAREWTELEQYFRARTEADFSHSICPTCVTEHFGAVPGNAGS